MNPEDMEDREAYIARLKSVCEPLGLIVNGTVVVVPLTPPIAIDASCIDLRSPVPALLYLAHKMGEKSGASELRENLKNLLLAPELEATSL